VATGLFYASRPRKAPSTLETSEELRGHLRHRFWIAQWWEDGHRRKKTLGRQSELTKSEARLQLAQIVSFAHGLARHRSITLLAIFWTISTFPSAEGCSSHFFQKWQDSSLDLNGGNRVFPSEKGKTPVAKDTCWRRHFAPTLKSAGLEWVNFHVMRRTRSSLMGEKNVDPTLLADRLGHPLNVNLNIYTDTAHRLRKEAADARIELNSPSKL
jgi:integrase